MKNLTKRIAVTVSSVAVAGAAVLGAGGTASAATTATAPVEHPGVSVRADDHRWDHGVGYLLEQGYSWDAVHGWHQDDRAADSASRGHDGHLHRSYGEGRDWPSGDWYRHDGLDGHHLDRNDGHR
ncbi:hypothetical protein ABZ357_19155 [Streptomyces sp. NPDC005917]|uniref:hypothetical protein n=1 Tax=unclassified Streptomyces TaxID=2593676 RepID=UPI00340C762A